MYHIGLWPVAPSIQNGFHITGNEIKIESEMKDRDLLFYTTKYRDNAGWICAKEKQVTVQADIETNEGSAMLVLEMKHTLGGIDRSVCNIQGESVVRLSETVQYYRIRLEFKQTTYCQLNNLVVNGMKIVSNHTSYHLDSGNGFTLHNAQKCNWFVMDSKGFTVDRKPEERGDRILEFQGEFDAKEVVDSNLKMNLESETCEVSIHLLGYKHGELIEKKKYLNSEKIVMDQNVDKIRVMLAIKGSGYVKINELMLGDFTLWIPITMFPYSLTADGKIKNNHPQFPVAAFTTDQIFPYYIPVEKIRIQDSYHTLNLLSQINTCGDAKASVYISWTHSGSVRELYHYPANSDLTVEIPEWVKIIEIGFRVEEPGIVNFNNLECSSSSHGDFIYPLAVDPLKEKEVLLFPNNGFLQSDIRIYQMADIHRSSQDNEFNLIDDTNPHYWIQLYKPDMIIVDAELLSQQGRYGMHTERLTYLINAFPSLWWVVDVSLATTYAMNWIKDHLNMIDLVITNRKPANSHVIYLGHKYCFIDDHQSKESQLCNGLGFDLHEKKDQVEHLYTKVSTRKELDQFISYLEEYDFDNQWRIVIDYAGDIACFYNRYYPANASVIHRDNLDLYPDMANYTFKRLIDLPLKERSS